MLKLISFLSIAVALGGCATKPIAANRAAPVPPDRLLAYQTPVDGGGAIIAVRDTGFLGGGCNMAVYIDGTLAAQIGHGETARFSVAPGSHIVGTGPTGRGTCRLAAGQLRREVETTVGGGETRTFRISINPNSGPAIEATAF